MTDPQDDEPCAACDTEGSRSRLDEDGLCPDCRTPAGRLVTALGSLGIKAEASDARTVSVGAAVVDLDDGPWTIMGADADGITAADAIAAIVQAPGLRAVALPAESSAIVVVDAVAAERMAIGAWLRSLRVVHPDLDKIARGLEHGDHIDDDAPPMPSLRMTLLLRDELLRQVETLTAERDTLAARVAKLEGENVRLTSRVEIFAGALLSLGAS